MVVFIRVATAQNLDDPTVLDSLLETESWQTLVTFARESARTSCPLVTIAVCTNVFFFFQRLNVLHNLHQMAHQLVS